MLQQGLGCPKTLDSMGPRQPRSLQTAGALRKGVCSAQSGPFRRISSSSGQLQPLAHSTAHIEDFPSGQPHAAASVGALLLQQSSQAPLLSLGSMLLQQPYVPLPTQKQSALQQQQHKQSQWRQQQQARQFAQQGQQPSQVEPSVSRPVALTQQQGFVVTRQQRYAAPEALQLRGHVWSEPTVDDLERAVLQMPAEAVAAAAVTAAADAARVAGPGLLLGVEDSNSYSGSRPQLFFALQAVMAEQEALPVAADEQIGSAAGQKRQPVGSRRRRRTTTSSSSSSAMGEGRPVTSSGLGRTSTSSSVAAPQQASSRTRRRTRTKTSSSSSSPHPSPFVSNAPAALAPTPAAQAAHAGAGGPAAGSSHSASSCGPASTPDQSAAINSSSSSSGALAHSPVSFQQQQASPAWQSEEAVLLRLHEALEQRGLRLTEQLHFGGQRVLCPYCQGGSSGEVSLSITLSEDGDAMWNCFRATCAEKGGFRLPSLLPKRRTSSSTSTSSSSSSSTSVGSCDKQELAGQVVPQPLAAELGARLQPLSAELQSWLVQERKISPAVLARNRVSMADGYSGASIAFPYYQGGELVNIKYRSLSKQFSQVKGGQQVLYGVDDLQGAHEAIIVEGELDKLAIETALSQRTAQALRVPAVLSLPAGAVPAPKHGQPNPHSKKLACMDAAAAQLAGLQRIIIAVDGDGPGLATAEALRHKLQWLRQQHAGQQASAQQVLYLPWPTAPGGMDVLGRVAERADLHGAHLGVAAAASCKDANDVLRVCGRTILKWYIDYAMPL